MRALGRISCGSMVRYRRKRSFLSLCFCPRSLAVPVVDEKLPLRLSVLRPPSLPQRCSWGLFMAARTGEDEVELLAEEDVLPKRRCVESVTMSLSLSPPSHHGQVSLRVSHP